VEVEGDAGTHRNEQEWRWDPLATGTDEGVDDNGADTIAVYTNWNPGEPNNNEGNNENVAIMNCCGAEPEEINGDWHDTEPGYSAPFPLCSTVHPDTLAERSPPNACDDGLWLIPTILCPILFVLGLSAYCVHAHKDAEGSTRVGVASSAQRHAVEMQQMGGFQSGAMPVAQAVESTGALRERLALQAQRIAQQDHYIHQIGLGPNRHPGRFVKTEDMNLRLKFLRKKACKLACSPARIVPTILFGWAAMWIFIWCYLWNWGTNLFLWFVLQFLHVASAFNSPFVEYAQYMIMIRAGQQNFGCCGLWKSSYKLEGPDDDHLYYTV
jgi:hypothetical protein